MEKKLTSSRREFLRNMLGMVIVSAAAPTVLLGRILPSISQTTSGQLVATYTIKVSDYPALASIGGSIKLTDAAQLNLNPDHVQNHNDALRAKNINQGWYPIAITRVASSGTDAFKAVSTWCLHGGDYQIKYLASGTPNTVGQFKCPGHGSIYQADGTWVPKVGAPPLGDPNDPTNATGVVHLRQFPATFDGTYITLNQVLADVGDVDDVPSRLFLDQNYPNPFNPATVIRYGLPTATQVRITVHTLLGNQVKVLVDQRQEAGVYYYDFSAVDLPSGVYFYRLQTSNGTLTRRMTVSK